MKDNKNSLPGLEERINESNISVVSPTFDQMLLENFTLDDIDLNTLHHYREQFKITHRNHSWNELDDEEFLRQIGCLRLDRKTGESWLTVAGLLMFGKSLPFLECFNNIRLDYIDENNSSLHKDHTKRLTYDGTWEYNLYNFITLVMKELSQDFKHPFHMEGIQRIEYSPEEDAFKEAISNIIIHSDYSSSGTLLVKRKISGVFFSNPDSLIIPLEEINHGGISKPRNPGIQKILEIIKFCKSDGEGFKRILKLWKEQNYRQPDFSYIKSLGQVELKLWIQPLFSKELDYELKQLYHKSYSLFDHFKKIILMTVAIEEEPSYSRLEILTGLTKPELDEHLKWLSDHDFIESVVFRNESIYKLNPEKINSEYAAKSVESNNLSNSDDTENLSLTENSILNYLEQHESITTSKVIEITEISTRQGALKALNHLANRNILEKRLVGRTYHYSKRDS